MDGTTAAIAIDELHLETTGLWSTQRDARGLLTMSHPHAPSAAGAEARATGGLPAASSSSGSPARRFLRFYVSDGYAGHRTGNPELGYPREWFPQARFVSVAVGESEVWRSDVLGENPPVDERFHQIEIPAAATGDLVLKVEDVEGVDASFATDVFWALLAVVTVPEGLEPPAFDRTAAPRPQVEISPVRVATVEAELPTLTIANPSAFDRAELVTSGVPFPPGRLAAAATVTVVDAGGRPLPTQQRPLARWPDGSVKSLLLDWPVQVAGGSSAVCHLQSGASDADGLGDPSRLRFDRRLTVESTDDAVTVDTGVARVSFARAANIIEEVSLGGDVVVRLTEPLGQVLNHEGFPSRFAGVLPPDRLEVIETGSLRVRLVAEGAYPDVEGATGLRYACRFDLCAGSADIRLQHTVTNTTAGAALLRALSVRLAGPGGDGLGLEAFDADGGAGPFEGTEAWLVQPTHERFYRWRYNGGVPQFAGEGERNRGYALASGTAAVGISLRHMWEQHANGFRLDESGLQVDLWTSDRIPWVLGSDAPLKLMEGEAKTHDLLLSFDSGDEMGPMRQRLAAFQEPLFGVAPAAWYCRSGLFGPIAAADAGAFPRYEAAVAAMDPGMMGHGRGGVWNMLAQYTHEERETYQRYGFRNFGDNPLIWGYQTKYRMWANCEYDVAHCALTQFARSGDLRFLWRGQQAALHNRDTDVIHACAEHPEWVGAPHGHWIDHAEKAPNLGHLWTEGMVEHYLLTGDERSLAVAGGIGDYCIRALEGGWGGSGERTAGWPMIALLGVWHGTGEERYLRTATRLRDDVLAHQDDVRGVWSYKVYEQPAYEGGTVFMVDILCRSLMRYHLATGDPAAAAAIVRAAQWLRHEAITDTPEAPLAFYKQTPLCSRPGSCSPETLATAYALTGDEAFGDLARRAYGAAAQSWSGGVPTAMMRDLPRVLRMLRPEVG